MLHLSTWWLMSQWVRDTDWVYQVITIRNVTLALWCLESFIFFSPLWLATNETSITKKKAPLHSIRGHLRGPYIRAPKAGYWVEEEVEASGRDGSREACSRFWQQVSMTFLAGRCREVQGKDSKGASAPPHKLQLQGPVASPKEATVTVGRKRKRK